jgi:hypothetical protein
VRHPLKTPIGISFAVDRGNLPLEADKSPPWSFLMVTRSLLLAGNRMERNPLRRVGDNGSASSIEAHTSANNLRSFHRTSPGGWMLAGHDEFSMNQR